MFPNVYVHQDMWKMMMDFAYHSKNALVTMEVKATTMMKQLDRDVTHGKFNFLEYQLFKYVANGIDKHFCFSFRPSCYIFILCLVL